jgi:NAD-dependent SIR2 family protein deacetylase
MVLPVALDTLKEKLGQPSVVLFNAGSLSVAPKSIVNMAPEDMAQHMQMNVVTGFDNFRRASCKVVLMEVVQVCGNAMGD